MSANILAMIFLLIAALKSSIVDVSNRVLCFFNRDIFCLLPTPLLAWTLPCNIHLNSLYLLSFLMMWPRYSNFSLLIVNMLSFYSLSFCSTLTFDIKVIPLSPLFDSTRKQYILKTPSSCHDWLIIFWIKLLASTSSSKLHVNLVSRMELLLRTFQISRLLQ